MVEVPVLSAVLGLIGGVGGALLTEFFFRRREARRRPKLSLTLQEALAVGSVGGNSAAYARLDVANDPKSDGAEGVSVRVDRARGSAGDEAEKLAFLENRQLAWANDDRGDPNVPPKPKTVAAGAPRGIDLAHLNSSVAKLIVDVRPQPGNSMNRLGAGTYTFELVVSGDNAGAGRYGVDIVRDSVPWDGQYATAADRLRVENLERL